MKKARSGILWIVGLGVLGFIIAFILISTIQGAVSRTQVWVATSTIPANTKIKSNEISQVSVPTVLVPSGSVLNSKNLVGLYSDSIIASQTVIVGSEVAPATTIRQLIRIYGMNFVGATLQIDPSDVPISDIQPGDVVDLVGVYTEGQSNTVKTQWIATGVPVLGVDTTSNPKVILAIPEKDALSLTRDITTGKVRVMLDPNPFHGHISFSAPPNLTSSTNQSTPSMKKATLPLPINKASVSSTKKTSTLNSKKSSAVITSKSTITFGKKG